MDQVDACWPANNNQIPSLKVNMDAIFRSDSGEAVAGVVVRNHEGSILCVDSRKLIKCSDAEEAEARVCIEGQKVIMQLTEDKFGLQSDYAGAITNIVVEQLCLSS